MVRVAGRVVGVRGLWWLVLAAMLSTVQLGAPLVAAAQGRGGSSEDREYRSAVEEALAEFNRGNWTEAAALFERAHRLNPSARTLRGMGLTAYEDRRYVDAIKHLADALKDTRRPLTQAQREEVSATLERAQRFVAHLTLKIEPRTARVTINGRLAETDSMGELTTDPGMLDIEITADNHEPVNRRIRLNAGGNEQLQVQLQPIRTAEPANQLPAAPALAVTPAAVDSSSEDEGGPLGVAKWVVGGAAVAGLLTGGALLVHQKVRASTWERDCKAKGRTDPPCEALRIKVGGVYYTYPIVAFSVGGGLAAIAVVLFVVDAADDDVATARNGCGAGPGELGISCRVAF
jgi:hypothetical protein